MTRLLAVTDRDLTELRLEEGRWTARRLRGAVGMRAAAVHPSDARTIFSGARGEGLHRSTDGGATWRSLELPEADVFAVAASPADGAVYAGTEPSRLFRSRDLGESWDELEALQEIPSRDRWSFPPRPHTSHVRAIAPHPDVPNLLLVGIELGGVMRTTDGGATFEDHAAGAVRDVHALAWHPRRTDHAYEAGGGGAAWTHDRGDTWRRLDAGRERDYCWGLAVDPADPDTWYVSAAASASRAHRSGASDAAVYRSVGGAPWERVGDGLPEPLDAFPYALAATDGKLFVGLADGRIFAADIAAGRSAETRAEPDAESNAERNAEPGAKPDAGRSAEREPRRREAPALRFAPIDLAGVASALEAGSALDDAGAAATAGLRELIPIASSATR